MFTKQQIEEIASKLKLMSKKDSSFGTINDIMDNDEFPILDNKVKRNIIGMLIEEYDIKSAKDIEDALKAYISL